MKVISTNFCQTSQPGGGLLTTASSTTQQVAETTGEEGKSMSIASGAAAVFSGTVTSISANGPHMAAAAFSSAAAVTENMSHLGIKNFSSVGLFNCFVSSNSWCFGQKKMFTKLS